MAHQNYFRQFWICTAIVKRAKKTTPSLRLWWIQILLNDQLPVWTKFFKTDMSKNDVITDYPKTPLPKKWFTKLWLSTLITAIYIIWHVQLQYSNLQCCQNEIESSPFYVLNGQNHNAILLHKSASMLLHPPLRFTIDWSFKMRYFYLKWGRSYAW